jgi:hypothetical protein
MLMAGAVLGTSTIVAAQESPGREEMLQKIRDLEQRLATLEQLQADAAPRGSADRSATREAVRADAAARGKLDGVTARYDRGLVFKNADDTFSLKPGVQWQFRGVSTWDRGSDEIQSGFENRRLWPRVDGFVLSPKLTYSIAAETLRNGGSLQLIDAFVQWQFAEQWALKAGQFKLSAFHERDISAFAQLAVDRSLADTLLGGNLTDRVQGLAIVYGGKADAIHGQFTFHDGALSANTGVLAEKADFGVGGRGELKLAGEWADYRDFTARQGQPDLVVLGVGANLTQAGDGNQLLTTADAQWKFGSGLSIYAAAHANWTSAADAGDEDAFDYGGVAQVGYLVNPKWEPFARYCIVVLDEPSAVDEHTFHEITAGVNRYLGENGSWGHRAKLTLDLVYLPSGLPSNLSGIGEVISDEDEFAVRAQFTLQL